MGAIWLMLEGHPSPGNALPLIGAPLRQASFVPGPDKEGSQGTMNGVCCSYLPSDYALDSNPGFDGLPEPVAKKLRALIAFLNTEHINFVGREKGKRCY